MMRLPVLHGIIRRRVLLNFRVDPEVLQAVLPKTFRPKLHKGYGIAGICLIRLEQVRPAWMPAGLGISSENAAHRIAVMRHEDEGSTPFHEGVYIPRRDTCSLMNHLVGGRLFPGEHHLAKFAVEDTPDHLSMDVSANDGGMSLKLEARESQVFPATSCFESLDESSAFFEAGKLGWSVTQDCCELDAVRLEVSNWIVRPLEVLKAESSFFADLSRFPQGSVTFDHALIMRDMQHEWHGEDSLRIP